MARFFLIMVKEMVNMFCQKMAIAMGKARYRHKGLLERGMDVVTSDVAQMAGEGMVASILSGPGLAKLGAGMFGALKAVAGEIPILGAVVKGADAFAEVMGGPALEAMNFATELALYKQDMNKSFESVLDIMAMVADPLKCMGDNAEVTTSDSSKHGEAISGGTAGTALSPHKGVAYVNTVRR